MNAFPFLRDSNGRGCKVVGKGTEEVRHGDTTGRTIANSSEFGGALFVFQKLRNVSSPLSFYLRVLFIDPVI